MDLPQAIETLDPWCKRALYWLLWAGHWNLYTIEEVFELPESWPKEDPKQVIQQHIVWAVLDCVRPSIRLAAFRFLRGQPIFDEQVRGLHDAGIVQFDRAKSIYTMPDLFKEKVELFRYAYEAKLTDP